MQAIGNMGEEVAASFFLDRGARVMEQNFRYKRSEIDLVLLWENVMVFVEIKTRKNSEFGNPENFISENQQDKIREAAEIVQEIYRWTGPVRFDVLSIIADQGKIQELFHLADAF